MMRTLYDIDYIASGCTIPFDESTSVDSTTLSWATSYALAGVSFLSAALVFKQQRSKALLMMLYFSFTGIGYTVAGTSHQFGTLTNDWQYFACSSTDRTWHCLVCECALYADWNLILLLQPIVDCQLTMACGEWRYICNNLYIPFPAGTHRWPCTYSDVQYFAMSMLYGWVFFGWEKVPGKRWAMFLKILAMWTNIAALVEQFIHSETCGKSGYENCFNDCPLSDPVIFNHNDIFHILLIVGMCLLTISELKLPTHVLWELQFCIRVFFSFGLSVCFDNEPSSSVCG